MQLCERQRKWFIIGEGVSFPMTRWLEIPGMANPGGSFLIEVVRKVQHTIATAVHT